MKRCLLWLALAGAAVVAGAASPPLNGSVTRVVDGDTLWFAAPGQAPLVVRLRHIDAPEACQPWGAEATRALAELALNKPATLHTTARDSHGRVVASVVVDEVDVGKRLVEEGHAWSVRTRYDQGPLVKQERMAKALARGLHGQGGSTLPWEFRRAHGACSGLGGAPTPPPTPAAAPTAAQPSFRCDGRRFCSQMSSCAEAKQFLRHCPHVEMDGDGDGIPCEKQWCGTR